MHIRLFLSLVLLLAVGVQAAPSDYMPPVAWRQFMRTNPPATAYGASFLTSTNWEEAWVELGLGAWTLEPGNARGTNYTKTGTSDSGNLFVIGAGTGGLDGIYYAVTPGDLWTNGALEISGVDRDNFILSATGGDPIFYTNTVGEAVTTAWFVGDDGAEPVPTITFIQTSNWVASSTYTNASGYVTNNWVEVTGATNSLMNQWYFHLEGVDDTWHGSNGVYQLYDPGLGTVQLVTVSNAMANYEVDGSLTNIYVTGASITFTNDGGPTNLVFRRLTNYTQTAFSFLASALGDTNGMAVGSVPSLASDGTIDWGAAVTFPSMHVEGTLSFTDMPADSIQFSNVAGLSASLLWLTNNAGGTGTPTTNTIPTYTYNLAMLDGTHNVVTNSIALNTVSNYQILSWAIPTNIDAAIAANSTPTLYQEGLLQVARTAGGVTLNLDFSAPADEYHNPLGLAALEATTNDVAIGSYVVNWKTGTAPDAFLATNGFKLVVQMKQIYPVESNSVYGGTLLTSSVVNTNGFTNNFALWSGPTNTVTLTAPDVVLNYDAAGDVAVTNFGGMPGAPGVYSTVLCASNSTAATIFLRVTASNAEQAGAATTNALAIPAGKRGWLNVIGFKGGYSYATSAGK